MCQDVFREAFEAADETNTTLLQMISLTVTPEQGQVYRGAKGGCPPQNRSTPVKKI